MVSDATKLSQPVFSELGQRVLPILLTRDCDPLEAQATVCNARVMAGPAGARRPLGIRYLSEQSLSAMRMRRRREVMSFGDSPRGGKA